MARVEQRAAGEACALGAPEPDRKDRVARISAWSCEAAVNSTPVQGLPEHAP